LTDSNPGIQVQGDETADLYDELNPEASFETQATVETLAMLAEQHPQRSVLEFGVGTGRIVLGLQARGIRVRGVDCSEKMVSKLREKPGGDQIDVVLGDHSVIDLGERFSVVALVFNAIFDRRGRKTHLDIFRNAAKHLLPGGHFVVEALVLNDKQRDGSWSLDPRYVGLQHVKLQFTRYDIETDQIERTMVHIRPEGPEFVRTVSEIYVAPGELDVMAEVAGFERVARYANWTEERFTSSSSNHVTIYRLTSEE
jgi:ubiquinone/menaquinone biosynthesis C-methylase UbiE